jgi:glucose-6-phosphate 1-epimerase
MSAPSAELAVSAAGGAALPALAAALFPLTLRHAASGASATLTLFGAQLLSYVHGGQEALFLSTRAVLDGSRPIRGGIPIAFPQFAAQGPLPMHGFARTALWRLEHQGDGVAVLALSDSEATRALWPHAFSLRYTVTFDGPTLTTALAVTNSGAAPLAFEALLHTYVAGGGAGAVDGAGTGALTLAGLQGQAYFAKATGEAGVEAREALPLQGEFDRVYSARSGSSAVEVRGVAGPAFSRVTVRRRGEAGSASGSGSQEVPVDVVVWNPGAERAAAIADLGPEDWRSYVCVEPGRVAQATAPAGQLAPGASFTLTQVMELA